MVTLEQRGDVVVLPVQARPKARREGVVGEHAGRLKVAVTAPPDKGKANAALVLVLADALGLKPNQIELAAGQTSPAKTFHLTGARLEEIARRIEELLADAAE